MIPDRETVRFILENWSVPYSMLPRERNQDRERIIDNCMTAIEHRIATKPHPPQGETEIL